MQYSGVRLLPLALTHTVLFQRALPAREKNSAILQMYIIVAPDILWTPILAAPPSLSHVYSVLYSLPFGYLGTANETIPQAERSHSKINCVIIRPARNSSEPLKKAERFNSRILELMAP